MADHPEITWTPELESSIITGIQDGKSVRSIASEVKMAASSIIKHTVESTTFGEQYARAKEMQMEAMADDILRIADSADVTSYNPARLQVDTRKWLMSKMAPKRYGDKVEQFISGPAGGPLQAEITVNFVKPESK